MLHLRRTLNKSKGFLKSFRPKALILLYHRVIDIEVDAQLLCVSICNFNTHIKYLSENYNVVSLTELLSDKLKFKSKRTVALTFDDGYFDNYHFALPILEKYRVPATIFVSSGFVGSKKEFWWDELEQIFFLNDNLPYKLKFQVNNHICEYENVPEKKNECYNELIRLFKKLEIGQVNSSIAYLKVWAKIKNEARATHRCLSRNELIALSSSNFIEIGAHTVTHCSLAKENPEKQKNEIITSIKQLESIIGKRINLFSYPFGSTDDYDIYTVNHLKDLGLTSGISNNQGLLFNKSDKYQIPRFLIRNWQLTEFKYNLNQVFRYNYF